MSNTNGRTYVLVQFIEDNIFYVCSIRNLSTKCDSGNTVLVKYKNWGRYSAKIICFNDCQKTLLKVKESLECGTPWVVLSRMLRSEHGELSKFICSVNTSFVNNNYSLQ
ncbi:hypothetical protein NQ314_009521 [Rhamnusium bicolor]|uniref:Uncharacterized protein n=1 Tax=Rhamnusium bicolor TaxID=1586634 RepID=A0AAV8Y0C3_9CUCU|nr:hypothetical protein NQ314_009521 [Rhamnusium bicolor]